MNCRPGCGACCVAISISSPIPGMPQGKPAGVRCVQLSESDLCKLFESSLRPKVCLGFRPASDTCGATREEAVAILSRLERETAVARPLVPAVDTVAIGEAGPDLRNPYR